MSETSRLRSSIAALTKRVETLESQIVNIGSGSGGSGSYDADAIVGFTAAGITDTLTKDAINDLIVGLKANSLWTKIKGLYPLAGGTVLSNSINFKTPNTGDLTIHPSATNNAFGLKSNGGPNAAQVNGNALDFIVNDNTSVGLFSTTDVTQEVSDFICAGVDCYWNLHMRWSNGETYADCYKVSGDGRVNIATPNSIGHYYMSRIGTEFKFYKQGVLLGTAGTGADNGTLGAYTLQIGSASTKNYAFFWFGDGLYGAELVILNSLFQGYIIAMGRG